MMIILSVWSVIIELSLSDRSLFYENPRYIMFICNGDKRRSAADPGHSSVRGQLHLQEDPRLPSAQPGDSFHLLPARLHHPSLPEPRHLRLQGRAAQEVPDPGPGRSRQYRQGQARGAEGQPEGQITTSDQPECDWRLRHWVWFESLLHRNMMNSWWLLKYELVSWVQQIFIIWFISKDQHLSLEWTDELQMLNRAWW